LVSRRDTHSPSRHRRGCRSACTAATRAHLRATAVAVDLLARVLRAEKRALSAAPRPHLRATAVGSDLPADNRSVAAGPRAHLRATAVAIDLLARILRAEKRAARVGRARERADTAVFVDAARAIGAVGVGDAQRGAETTRPVGVRLALHRALVIG